MWGYVNMAAVPEPHIVSSSNEYKLNNPPADLISNVQFAPDGSKFLLTSSWDSSVRLYELGVSCTSTFCRSSYQHQGPVLDCTFLDNPAKCASAGLDNFVKMYDFNSSAETILGAHEKPVRCVEYSSEMSLLITGSWDSTIKLWDSRTARCTSCLPQSERVYTMTLSGDRLIVGTAGRKVYIWNLRNMAAPEQKRDSSLKYQTRCIRAFPNKQAFVLASIEGQNFYSCFSKYPTSISALTFSADGSTLAIAASYQYEQPENPNPIPEDAIFIRKLTDQETRTKI
uniref:Mitotic checkpoint protein BUB3 n=1 Tax=Romanomermis culicivorax TaxID=13658 RepID=A0A915IN90_ROMCU